MTPAKPRMLFVDDRSKRIHAALKKYSTEYDVTIAPNVPEALRLLARGPWDVISLDYDLNGYDFSDPSDPTCGMEIVRYMSKLSTKAFQRQIIIHSSNILGADIMFERLLAEGFLDVRKDIFVYEGDE